MRINITGQINGIKRKRKRKKKMKFIFICIDEAQQNKHYGLQLCTFNGRLSKEYIKYTHYIIIGYVTFLLFFCVFLFL